MVVETAVNGALTQTSYDIEDHLDEQTVYVRSGKNLTSEKGYVVGLLQAGRTNGGINNSNYDNKLA